MELKEIKHKVLEFHFEDVVFIVKPEANEEDRLEVELSGRMRELNGAKIMQYSSADYCKAVIRCMVLDWRGVKRDGHDVPFSVEELKNFPHIKGKNIFLELGGFIINNTDIKNQRNEDLKKD
jgi:hypothetical protein